MEAAVIDKIAAWADSISERVSTQTGGKGIFMPPGATLERMEKLEVKPYFHRHHYSTERLADFVTYCRKEAELSKDASPTAYVQPDGSGAKTVFDHGDVTRPQWGHHTATLQLKPAPAWKTALAMAMGSKTQQQVIDWMEDWVGSIIPHFQNGDEFELRRAIAALRRIKLESKASITNTEGDFSRQKSAMESIEASGDTDTLPAYFTLISPLYVGTVEHSIVIRLGVREDNGKPVLALRIIGQERLVEETAAWVEKQLVEQFGNALAGVYVGTLEVGKP